MSCRIALAAVLFAAASTPSHAGLISRELTSGPTNYCQSALPVFDGNIRKRPLAVVNEGRGPAFITCSFPLQGSNGTLVRLYFSSVSGTASSVNCTAVSGYQGNSAAATKTVDVPAAGQALLSLRPNDFEAGATTFLSGLISVSCELKPGTAINDTYVYLQEEIGN